MGAEALPLHKVDVNGNSRIGDVFAEFFEQCFCTGKAAHVRHDADAVKRA